jgi:hypothetical protein
MDQQKMAEGRRVANEKRRHEEKSRREEAEKRQLEVATIHEFERLQGQLQAFYKEIGNLSKKHPDGRLNKFKLGFINDIVKRATALLGDAYRPFPNFETFAEEDMPSASDVGMMLCQYLESMDRFKTHHTFRELHGTRFYWHTKGADAISADGFRD